MSISEELEKWLTSLRENPSKEMRLIFADWYSEHGGPCGEHWLRETIDKEPTTIEGLWYWVSDHWKHLDPSISSAGLPQELFYQNGNNLHIIGEFNSKEEALYYLIEMCIGKV